MSEKLSGVQYAVLIGGNAAARARSNTYESLIYKGYLIRNPKCGRIDFTNKARDFVKSKMQVRKNIFIKDYPEYSNNIINSDEQILKIYAECVLCDYEIEIYIYRGKVGMVTVYYPDETYYKALIEPYYLWQVEIEKSAGKFLIKKFIQSSKGSYVYEIVSDWI